MSDYKIGDTILIKYPTKKEPTRVIKAYIHHIFETNRRFIQTKAENGRKINLYEDDPDIVGKVEDTR